MNKPFRKCACGKMIPWGKTSITQYRTKKKCGAGCTAYKTKAELKLNGLNKVTKFLDGRDEIQVGVTGVTGIYKEIFKEVRDDIL